jgi:chromosome segregation ATPase
VNFKTVSIAALLALPTTFVTHLVADTQATKRINEAEERVKGLERELQNAISKTTFLEDIEARSQHLSEELNKVRAALQLAVGEHQKAFELNQYLQQTLTILETDLEASSGRVEELQAECEEWELQFSDRVSVESEAKFQQAKKAEIERIFQEHDAITSTWGCGYHRW